MIFFFFNKQTNKQTQGSGTGRIEMRSPTGEGKTPILVGGSLSSSEAAIISRMESREQKENNNRKIKIHTPIME